MFAATEESARPADQPPTARYAACVEASRRVRWDIERDVIRGRQFDFDQDFMPDSLSKVNTLRFLRPHEMRFLSQIQGRTYANMLALVERYIGVKILQVSQGHWFGDQVAFEALVRFTDEELKHQELFRRLEQMAAAGMPAGYCFKPRADDVAKTVLGKSTWAVLALMLHIELFTQAHYRSSIEPDTSLSDLWKDVFLFHWKEESQHAILDELEWRREHENLTAAERECSVGDLIALFVEFDGVLQRQARADATYFLEHAGRWFSAAEEKAIRAVVLRAYRWQYIVSGLQGARFTGVLEELTTPAQMRRIRSALMPIVSTTGE
ncbi:MAG TPA: hypothetical protein VFR86_30100 [Burkholderiaceae bacterium]|nr:hypothetical protein [Burkholderiaceae bacterium]